jgi:hypothetical protein
VYVVVPALQVTATDETLALPTVPLPVPVFTTQF